MTKPITFNYQDYENLVKEHEELKRKYKASLLRITRLKAEITNLQIRCRIAEAENEQRLPTNQE